MDSYADVPYVGHPYARTHPDHLALLARLHGLSPADPDDCRVVELACGDGSNVIAMAAASTGVRVAGIDLEAGAIARGQALAGELGLSDRVDLRVADLLDAPELGEADYVICHGLYSWAPRAVADAALGLMAELLAPGGVGFLSFNLMPGWSVRRALGPALQRRGDLAAARALLGGLEAPLAQREDPYGALLAAERGRLAGLSDGLLFHDDLHPGTRAVWHADVVAHADHHGLHVLRDAHPATLQGSPPADQELADLASGAPYREVALVPATAAPAAQPTADGVRTLLVAEERRPVSGRREAERLLEALREGEADLHAAPARFTLTPGERPLAFGLARLQAARGNDVTTLRHTRLIINDDAGRAVLAACDGTRTRAQIATAALSDDRRTDVIDVAVARLAANALLLA